MAHPALKKRRIELGVPEEKMVTTGLFINPFAFKDFTAEDRREFLTRAMSIPDTEKDEAIWINGRVQNVREPAVHLDPDALTVTIASGRAGVGNYPVIVEGLIRQAKLRGRKIQIVAVCGDNRKNFAAVTELYDRLARAGQAEGVTLVASKMVDNIKLLQLVRSSALFIGKSGSQSPFEAAVMGVPRVLIDVIGGQERWTANFFRTSDLAEVVAANEQRDLAERAFAYLEDADRMARRRVADQVIRDSYRPFADHAFLRGRGGRQRRHPAGQSRLRAATRAGPVAVKFDLLIFDLDGTLIDSQLDVGAALNRVLTEHAVEPISAEVIREHVGYGIQPLILDRLKHLGEDELKAALAQFTAYYLERCVSETVIYDGVAELLSRLAPVRKVILTNKSNRFLSRIMTGLGIEDHFEAQYGRESFARPKPDPLPIVSILREHGIDAGRALMIGDTETDIVAGTGAGVPTCLVTYGYGRAAALANLRPTYTISNPAELWPLVDPSAGHTLKPPR